MKKISTETEPPLAQSFKGAPNTRTHTHTLNHTTPSSPFPIKSRRYTNPLFFNPVLILLLSNPTNTREISNSPQVRFLLVWSRLNSRFNSNHKKRRDSLESRAEPAVLCDYVENRTRIHILESILHYRASKFKQT